MNNPPRVLRRARIAINTEKLKLTIRVSEKSWDSMTKKIKDCIYYFFYGMFAFLQFGFPALFIYGVYLTFTNIIFGFLLVVFGGLLSIVLFAMMLEEGHDTIFVQINDKLHVLGWTKTRK